MTKIIFIVQQLSQPRCIKRIQSFQENGYQVKVYGFDNGLYNASLKQLPFPVIEVIKRAKKANKLKKIGFFISTIRRILSDNSKDDIFYFFGFEIASIAYFLGCKNYIYEEADVSAARIRNPIIRNLLLKIDRLTIRKSLCTAFTSQGFVNYIFKENQPENIVLLPNKLSKYFDKSQKDKVKAKEINFSNIKFGFIGLIRYPNTIIRFARVVGKEFPHHEFHFYGDAEREEYIDDEVKSYKNIYFHGSFTNPVDLQKIYRNIDINVVCYDTTSGNVRIAEPNKLYESIFFETPIVVSSNTFLAQRVNEFKIGDNIDASSDAAIISYINSLNENKINNLLSVIRKIPYSEVIDETDNFIATLKRYIKNTNSNLNLAAK